jgi:hypothetical protein
MILHEIENDAVGKMKAVGQHVGKQSDEANEPTPTPF